MQCIVRHCEHYLLVCPNAEELIGIPLVLHINKSSLRRQFAVVWNARYALIEIEMVKMHQLPDYLVMHNEIKHILPV